MIAPTLPGERWLPCPGDDRYEISNRARVQRIVPSHGATVGMIRRPQLHTGSGKLCVTLSRVVDGKRSVRCLYVARLVLEAFCRAPRPGEEARHRNGDSRDCRPENLYWSGDASVRLIAHRCRRCGKVTAPPKRGRKDFCLPGENGDCAKLRHREKSRLWWRANRSLAAKAKRAA